MILLIRGTTPTHSFTFPYDEGIVDKIYITYCQNGKIRIEKSKDDITFNPEKGIISVSLTQEETLKFYQNDYNDKYTHDIEVQIRFIDKTGKAYASNIVDIDLERILKDGVI